MEKRGGERTAALIRRLGASSAAHVSGGLSQNIPSRAKGVESRMNGDIYLTSSITAAAKKAIQTGGGIQYTPPAHENISFTFLPVKRFFGRFGRKVYAAPDVPSWFAYSRRRGLEDVKFLCPVAVENRELLGFANTAQACILCFFDDGRATCFTSGWYTDRQKNMWDIVYTEQEYSVPPAEKPRFANNLDSFRKALLEIQDFAVAIGCEGFANTFEEARKILEGGDIKRTPVMPELPELNLRLFEAAGKADVFHAMGSWNDSPPYMASEKGLEEEFDRVSEELLKNIRLAVLYAVNEW